MVRRALCLCGLSGVQGMVYVGASPDYVLAHLYYQTMIDIFVHNLDYSLKHTTTSHGEK
jgi:hypothetical protein